MCEDAGLGPYPEPSLPGDGQVTSSSWSLPASWGLDPSCKLEPPCRVGCLGTPQPGWTGWLPSRKGPPYSLLSLLGSFPSCPSLPQRKKTPSAPGAQECGCCPPPGPMGQAEGNREQCCHSSLPLVSAVSLCSLHSIWPNAQSGIGRHKEPI